MYRRWICNDVWMDILPLFDRPELGLNLALLSDRFDILVDKHFDGKTTELTIWKDIRIDKDEGPEPKLSVRIDGKFVAFPMPDRPLPNKIRFKDLQIDYIDHSVIEFVRSNKQIWDRRGTNLELSIDNDDQLIWDVFCREIWPNFATNIRHLSFTNDNHLDNLRHGISLTILTDLDQLNSIDSGLLLPDGIADDGPNATARQALFKWVHTPSKNGQPKQLVCADYDEEVIIDWVNSFKEAFLCATASVSYNNEFTEKLLKRCPISEKAATDQWENEKNWDDNLNNVQFNLCGGKSSYGPYGHQRKKKKRVKASKYRRTARK